MRACGKVGRRGAVRATPRRRFDDMELRWVLCSPFVEALREPSHAHNAGSRGWPSHDLRESMSRAYGQQMRELRHIRSKEGVKKTSWPCAELLELAP